MRRLAAWDEGTPRAVQRRRALLDLVAARPGITLRQICLTTGLGVGTARHHLGILGRWRLVWHTMFRAGDRYFPGAKPLQGEVPGLLAGCLAPSQAAALAVVREHGPLKQAQVVSRMDVPPSTAQHAVKRLVELGLVTERAAGRCRLYEAIPEVA